MLMISELIHNATGIEFQNPDKITLRNGRMAERVSIEIGNIKVDLMLVYVPETFQIKHDIKDLIQLAEYERVIIYVPHLFPDQMEELKDQRIGYIDNEKHFYIPFEIVSSDSYQSKKRKDAIRSSSTLNEFPLGYLFLKNYGLLEKTQAEIAKLIGKSPATVNITLKKMEKEGLIVRTETGLHLTHLENYFNRWRFIISQYKLKKEYSRFTCQISNEELKEMQFVENNEWKWSFSGPRIESLLDDGYLENASEFSIFIEVKSQKKIMNQLKLIPKNNGEIVLYPTFTDLRSKGQFVHDILISAELINSNNPRLKEAGERRLEKYLDKANRIKNERFGNKGF